MPDFDAVSYMMGQKAGPGGGSSTLSGLTDVDISNPSDGQTLVYNATSGKWENGNGGGGGLVVNVVDHNDGEYLSLDKTAGEIYSAFIAGKHISFRASREDDGITAYEIGVMSVVEHGTIDNGPFEGMEAFSFVLDNGQHFVGGEFQTIGADTYPVTNFNPPQ